MLRRGIRSPVAGSCVRAASGHAADAPPSSVMNTRRPIIRSPRRLPPAANLPKGRPHDLHVVFRHEILVRLSIDTLPFRKHLLEPAGCHTKQQHTGLCPYVLERMRGPARNEEKGPGGRAHNTFAQFEVEL